MHIYTNLFEWVSSTSARITRICSFGSQIPADHIANGVIRMRDPFDSESDNRSAASIAK